MPNIVNSLSNLFSNHPKGLFTLFFTELWERFSYYGMRAILVLYIISEQDSVNSGLGWSNSQAITLYGWYTALVYLLCVPGGWLADKYITHKNAVLYGGWLLCLGHLLLAIKHTNVFFLGLLFIIIGVGLLKPSISTLVGSLYKETDIRRDQGFTIFYIGINLGAFFASILVGFIGEVYGWHYGFSLAGFGMVVGQIFFIRGKKHLQNDIKRKSDMEGKSLTKIQIDRIKLIIIASFILIVFWAAFEQAGGLLNIYAYEKTNRVIDFINFEIPASWFQSINPLMIIIFGYFISLIWLKLEAKNYINSSILKIAIGIMIMGSGFIFMFFASVEADTYGKSSMYWLVLAYTLITIGELCASPVILSYITKLSPKQKVSSIMGIYFATIGLGNKLAGTIGVYSQQLGEKKVFLGITLICIIVGLTVIISHNGLKKLAHGRLN